MNKETKFEISGRDILKIYECLEIGKAHAQGNLKTLTLVGVTTNQDKYVDSLYREDIDRFDVMLDVLKEPYEKAKKEWDDDFNRCYG